MAFSSVDDGHTECTHPQIGVCASPEKSDISDNESLIDKSICVFNSDDDQGDDINISFESTGEAGSPQGRSIYMTSIATIQYGNINISLTCFTFIQLIQGVFSQNQKLTALQNPPY